MKHKKIKKKPRSWLRKPAGPSGAWTIPFFACMLVLTVVAFIIPLRPTQSYIEKRALAEFPTFSVEALTSGSYFDDISTWFSDTFPGREGWLKVSSSVSELHGIADVAITGELVQADEIPVVSGQQADPARPVQAVTKPTQPKETEQTQTEEEDHQDVTLETTTPPEGSVEEWGGVDAGEDAEIILGNVIQIEDAAFSYFGFSQYYSDRYASIINTCAERMNEKGVRVVSALIPQAVGILVEKEYQEKLSCSDQEATIDYMLAGMSDSVYKVDMFQKLIDHNDEYLYFRTDHHWTGLGAYYGYESICETLGMEARPLEDFEMMDMGAFEGSLYWTAYQPSKLTLDNVYVWNPPGDIQFQISEDGWSFYDWPIMTDMSASNINSKYMAFIAGDHTLSVATNNDIPDAPNCVVIKDSCGNPVAPYLTQNYHKVYIIDYRKYNNMGLTQFVDEYDIDDVIFCHMLGMAQGEGTNNLLEWLIR